MGGTVAVRVHVYGRRQEVALLAMFDTVNWSRVRRSYLYDKISYQVQRLVFHCLNFGLLDFKDKIKFIQEKLKVLRSRTSVWRGWLSNKIGSVSESALLARIWQVNDQAILSYVPKQYPGTITDFRPMKQYSQYVGPDKDWTQLAREQQIVELPVYPAGMLLEPFVKDLALALRKSIDDRIELARCSR